VWMAEDDESTRPAVAALGGVALGRRRRNAEHGAAQQGGWRAGAIGQ
jgi:MYXO-CTERM domain-containing protein